MGLDWRQGEIMKRVDCKTHCAGIIARLARDDAKAANRLHLYAVELMNLLDVNNCSLKLENNLSHV